MSWFVYEIPPIDIGWEHLKSVRETLSDIVSYGAAYDGGNEIDASEINAFLRSWDHAKELAGTHSWEGDFREEPKVFWLPGDVEFRYGFVFKQDNNGTTYVVSPQELPALN
ncbi:hypothetical protein ACOJCM_11655 [Billgrantia sp. LNSP4103-1]|uniref:hypothetical protein n=1 Tax=Billgrantia sp. LNSP4103-1 TaxID=3410266 RepID=UPI00403F2053